MRVTIVGAGVAGLVAGVELAERGLEVEVLERAERVGPSACSWAAGGMLAPWCERENAEAVVASLGEHALGWWPRHIPGVAMNGTLVVAQRRDAAELTRFASRTDHFERIDASRIAALEPDLAGRFDQALFFAGEGHLDPRLALAALVERFTALGGVLRLGAEVAPGDAGGDVVLDCRGFAARTEVQGLRGVRGEMLLVRTRDVTLSRPVRLLHPRIPLYVVPRADGVFMVGATMIESASKAAVTARSAVELLNGAYALHPAFGEAEVLEMRADVRPAFADNLPRVTRDGRILRLNGLYRHGFLLSPALAREAADRVSDLILENDDEADRQRRTA